MDDVRDFFNQIVLDFHKQKDFSAFLNRKIHFDNRDWTYGQFLYKYFYDQVQDFSYQARDNFNGLSEKEKELARKVMSLFANNGEMIKPDAVCKKENIEQLDMFDGDKEKENLYNDLFIKGTASISTKENPCCWHPASQYQTRVIEYKLSRMGMSEDQILALMKHCWDKRKEKEEDCRRSMPKMLVHNSPISPEKMGENIQPRLRSVDTFLTTQKYCFLGEPDAFHSGLPIQGENTAILWPRFKGNVYAFQMDVKEFKEKTRNGSYNYYIDTSSQKDSIFPVIPLWGGEPAEWVCVKDLKYNPKEVEKETLEDLIKAGKRFYLIPKAEDWKLLEGSETLSQKKATELLKRLCKEGKAIHFSGDHTLLNRLQQLQNNISLEERFCKSAVGKALWMAYGKTSGFELTDEFKERALKAGKPLKERQTGQYTGGERNIILLDKEYTTPDLLVASIMHETAHAYQKFFLGLPMNEDGRNAEVDAIRNEAAYAAVIEADAWAKGLVTFIKSEPTDNEIRALQSTKGELLKQIGFFDIQKKKKLDEGDMSREIFEKMYSLLLPAQFNEKALQSFLDKVLNDKFYDKGGAASEKLSKELKKQEIKKLLTLKKPDRIP